MRKSQLTLVLATIMGLTLLSIGPVAADTTTLSADENTSTSTSTSTTSTGTSTSTTTNSEIGIMPSGTEEQRVRTEISNFHQKGLAELESERKTGEQHSEAARQKACDARQSAIDNRITNYAKAAQNNLNVFTSIFTKVQAFYTSKQLSVSNYTTLTANVTAAQTAAQQAVTALGQISSTKIDCTQPDPAQEVAAIKVAVDSARTALQTYRQSIKNLIVALEGASSAQSTTTTTTTTTTGGNQ